jgi:hypothetical protein
MLSVLAYLVLLGAGSVRRRSPGEIFLALVTSSELWALVVSAISL